MIDDFHHEPSPWSGNRARAVSAVVQARPAAFMFVAPLDPMLLAGWSRRQSIADMLLVLLGVLVWGAAVNAAAYLLLEAGYVASEIELGLPLSFINGLGWMAIVGWVVRRRGQGAASVGLVDHDIPGDILWAMVAIPATVAAHLLGLLITYLLWPGMLEAQSRNAEKLAAYMAGFPAWYFVVAFFGVSFYEELLFRGFLMTRLRRVFSSWVLAVVVSSALFALPHLFLQEPSALLSLFFLGCVFSIFTASRRSLLPAIVAHWTFNSVNVILLKFAVTFQSKGTSLTGSESLPP